MSNNRHRGDFKEMTFKRDGFRCVMCGAPAVDAHHVLDRKLFSDGGYHLDNLASLCGTCHLGAEDTSISVEDIREAAKITVPYLPDGFDKQGRYDKWGNAIRDNGTREQGPLFKDDGARRALGRLIYDGTFVFNEKYL